ncbi:MAG: MFS transporter [Candidatus Anstonellaceae archaeon]
MLKKHTKFFENSNKKDLFAILILFGIISLFGDIIYESSRGVIGPYLSVLGANAYIIGIVVGVAEVVGYLIRIIVGYFSDKTKAYWFFVILGYSLLFTVPILGIIDFWPLATIFLVLERIGKGLRSPARDTIVSYPAKKVGVGFGFGLLEFLDQIGGIIGPLIFSFLFFTATNEVKELAAYQNAYNFLWIFFIALEIILFYTFFKYSKKIKLPKEQEKQIIPKQNFPKIYWIYALFTFFTTIGFINFAIIGYHLKINQIVSDKFIPLLYAIAMGADAIFAILIGRIYDKIKKETKNKYAGLNILLILPPMAVFILLTIFSTNFVFIFLAIVLWGVVMACHETIMKAAITDLIPSIKLGFGYGIFNAVYGLSIFFGSIVSGYLYEISKTLLVVLLTMTETFALLAFFLLKKEIELQK